jgi:hypothetical protein
MLTESSAPHGRNHWLDAGLLPRRIEVHLRAHAFRRFLAMAEPQ